MPRSSIVENGAAHSERRLGRPHVGPAARDAPKSRQADTNRFPPAPHDKAPAGDAIRGLDGHQRQELKEKAYALINKVDLSVKAVDDLLAAAMEPAALQARLVESHNSEASGNG